MIFGHPSGSLISGLVYEWFVEQFIFSSTASVYGDPSDELVTNSSRVEPFNPFGWSKLMAEKILDDCAADAGLGVTIFRYFNVSGADPDIELGMRFENQTHLIPRLIEAAEKGTPFSIFGNDYDTHDGTCVRDYIHVWDIAAAHIAAIKSPVPRGRVRRFNLGLGQCNSVLEVLGSVERITGSKIDGTFETINNKRDIANLNVEDKNKLNIKTDDIEMFSKKAIYDKKKSTIELFDNVLIKRGNEIISGDYGIINTTKNSYKVSSNNSKKVKAIIAGTDE